MLLKSDIKKRLAWVRKVKKHNAFNLIFWQQGISLYIDAVGFEYKSNPFNHAKSLGKKEWRTIREGLHYGCTSKGCKEGKNYVRFLVGMSYGEGVTLCVPLEGKMSGQLFSEIIANNINPVLTDSSKTSRRILQDGCPCQNSRLSHRMLDRKGIECLTERELRCSPFQPDLQILTRLKIFLTK